MKPSILDSKLLMRVIWLLALASGLTACNYPAERVEPTPTEIPTPTATPVPTLVIPAEGVQNPPDQIAIEAFPHAETIDPETFAQIAVAGYTERFVVNPLDLGISPYWVYLMADVSEAPGESNEYYASRSYEWQDARTSYEYHMTINAYTSPYELDQLFTRSLREDEYWTVELDLPQVDADHMQYIVRRIDSAYTQILRFELGNYLVVVKTKNIADYTLASSILEQMAQMLIEDLLVSDTAKVPAH
jgi:hypothetical protein